MSSASTAVAAPTTIYLGLDVHKDSITIAVLRTRAKGPTRLEEAEDGTADPDIMTGALSPAALPWPILHRSPATGPAIGGRNA